MASQSGRRDGSFIVHTEPQQNEKYADGRCPRTGGLIFKSKDALREYAKGELDRTGRVLRVDPDGGIPRGQEMERMRAQERAAAEARRSQARRRR